MTVEEELRQENMALREQVHLLKEKNDWQEARIEELQRRTEQQEQQIEALSQQVQSLQDHVKKDSHNSSLPPSSDRFSRQKRSLREKSGKKAGGQADHEGKTLSQCADPDQVVVYPVERCEHCQADLHEVERVGTQRRQVIGLPVKRRVVVEHQTESKCCPHCQGLSSSSFPEEVRAPIQYGADIAAVAVYLCEQQRTHVGNLGGSVGQPNECGNHRDADRAHSFASGGSRRANQAGTARGKGSPQ